MFFTGREELHRLLPEDRERAALANVADLRATSARRPGDPAVRRLVAQLRRASPLFERLWATPASPSGVPTAPASST